ncbi:uncharacterized protein LY89DRAFT_666424 [Mollisia scopiformis]|uniref:Uncharacterized protein n=1 Tax=Mollisia scopiformis TaxID=149040 RepID=A0A194XLZ5_MOLSC|nr:uncharacterized protein LY89DRAFT_666424 [Mollisia scopiformis]KUJ20787.1 hypothetical protein LY89DRAFT_666424 [Mollisia scopiformis]
MANTSSSPHSSNESTSTLPATDALPEKPEYRFNFGKYPGRTLESVPPGYVVYLIKKNGAAARPDLKAALDKRPDLVKPKSNESSTSRAPLDATGRPRLRAESHDEVSPPPKDQKLSSSPGTMYPVRENSKTLPVARTDAENGFRPPLPQPPINKTDVQAGVSKQNSIYRIHFGRHDGKTLSEVPNDFILRLEKLINLPNFTQATPELRAALREFRKGKIKNEPAPSAVQLRPPESIKPESKLVVYKSSIPQDSRGPQRNHTNIPPKAFQKAPWTPPNLNYAPRRKFWDSFEEQFIWISASDATSFFGLTKEHFDQLPVMGGGKAKRFWLYHVWDLFRYNTSQTKADAALKAFRDKNDDKTHEIWGRLGLGPG